MPPAQKRPCAHQDKENQEERAIDLVKEGSRHADAVAGENFAEHGEKGSPQGCKGNCRKNPVIRHERSFAAGIGVNRLFILEQGQPLEEQPQEAEKDNDQKGEEEGPDIAARKAVNTLNNAAARGKGSEDHQEVGEPNQDHIPDLENPALLLDDDAV